MTSTPAPTYHRPLHRWERTIPISAAPALATAITAVIRRDAHRGDFGPMVRMHDLTAAHDYCDASEYIADLISECDEDACCQWNALTDAVSRMLSADPIIIGSPVCDGDGSECAHHGCSAEIFETGTVYPMPDGHDEVDPFAPYQIHPCGAVVCHEHRAASHVCMRPGACPQPLPAPPAVIYVRPTLHPAVITEPLPMGGTYSTAPTPVIR